MDAMEAPAEAADGFEAASDFEAPDGDTEHVDHSTAVPPPGEGTPEGDDETPDVDGPKEPELHEVKVDGKTDKVTLEELRRGYSANAVSTKRFQEAASIKQEAQQTLAQVEHLLVTDPARVLFQLGPQGIENAVLGLLESTDPNVQQAIDRAVKASTAGPEAKRQRQLERENEMLRQQAEQARTEQQKRVEAAQQQQVRTNFLKMAEPALKQAGLPGNDHTIRELAATYQQVFPQGDPISPETLSHAAKILANEKLPSVTTAYLQSVPPEKLAELLGQDRIKSLTQSQIEKVKAMQSAPPNGGSPRRETPPSRPSILEELRDRRAMERIKTHQT